MDFIVSYKLEQKDYYLFSLYDSKRRMILGPFIEIVIFSVAYFWALHNVSSYGMLNSLATTIYIVNLVSMLIVMPLIRITILRAGAGRQYRASMLVDFTIQLDAEGLQSHSAFGETCLLWADIYKVSESRSAAYLYFSSAQAIIIPKRFMSPEQYETLRTLCRTYLAPKKCKLK